MLLGSHQQAPVSGKLVKMKFYRYIALLFVSALILSVSSQEDDDDEDENEGTFYKSCDNIIAFLFYMYNYQT